MKTIYVPRYAYRRSQVGHGIGGIFRSLAKVFMPIAKTVIKSGKPFLKKVAKAAGKEAILVGMDTVNDIAQGDSVKNSVTRNIKAGTKRSYQRTKTALNKGSIQMLKKALKVVDSKQGAQTGGRPRSRKTSKRKKTILD